MISLEEALKIAQNGIKDHVSPPKESRILSGVKYPIELLFGKEILVVDWEPCGKSPISKDKDLLKFQFYLNGQPCVTFTTAKHLITACNEHEKQFGKTPFFNVIQRRSDNQIVFER